jgi:hypothetical protein
MTLRCNYSHLKFAAVWLILLVASAKILAPGMALRNFPVRNNPKHNIPESRKNPEHICKSRMYVIIPNPLTQLSPFPPHLA